MTATIHIHPSARVVDICRLAGMYKLCVVERNNRMVLVPHQTAFRPKTISTRDSVA